MNSITLPDQKTITLKKQLGEGTFGTVYEIDYQGAPAALKIVDKSKIQEQKLLRTEIDIINKINEKHPNCAIQHLLCYQEIQEDQDQIYFISQLMEKDLFEFIHSKEFTDFDICKKIELIYEFLLEIIEGLDVLHQIGIIHRDIKLENFLIGKDNQGEYILKVSDFGLSCMIEECKNTRAGSMGYLSPRILFALRSPQKIEWFPYDDLYSTALVIYECLMYDLFFNPEDIRDQLMTPKLTYDQFIQDLYKNYIKGLMYLQTWKKDAQKFCSFQVVEKMNRIIEFLTVYLNPKITNWKTYNTTFAKTILKP